MIFSLSAAAMPVFTPTQAPTEQPNLTAYNVTFIITQPSFQEIQANSSHHASMIANEVR